jgi:uncharacterized metal-binding protein YceD (DUF177 family)
MHDAGSIADTVFSRRIAADEHAKLDGRIKAGPEECARMAEFLRIEKLDNFQIQYQLKPLANHRFRLSGEISANVTQLCVVTLEPVRDRIRESFTVEFWPAGDIEALNDSEQEASPDYESPEPIVAGKIDIGALAAEILASAINPYPRKADAEFVWDGVEDDAMSEPSGPFAKLAKLRPDR